MMQYQYMYIKLVVKSFFKFPQYIPCGAWRVYVGDARILVKHALYLASCVW